MGTLWQDVRYGMRMLTKDPGFTAVALLTLALGIGANTAIFGVLDRLLVRPLPVRNPHQLALLAQELREGRLEYEFNYPLFRDYQRGNSVFSCLSATAGLVLMIVCANLANLQLARATARTRAFAVRAALGASRSRLIRELLTESLLLSFIGGALGVLVALWRTGLLEHFRLAGASFELAGGLDARVLGFAFVMSLFTGIVFGLTPAWGASRPQLVSGLKGGGRVSGSRSRRWNLRDAPVVSQVGLSLLVLIGAGLCLRSLEKLQRIDPGFEPSRVMLVSFGLGLNHYNDAQANVFYDRLLERVRTLPGVEAAGLIWNTPLSGGTPGMSADRIEGYPPAGRRESIPWRRCDMSRIGVLE